MTVRPAEVFPPGEFLREELEARGWSQADFADILGRPPRLINEIIAGKRRISPETANGIAAALDTTPEFWLNLEAAYQLGRLKNRDSDTVSRRAKLYGYAPVKEMVRRGWIEPSDSVAVLEQQVFDFFEIASFDEELVFFFAARKSTSYDDALTPGQKAWLARAKKMARAVSVGPYSVEKLDAAITQLQGLLHVPQEIRHVPRVLADAGVKFVILEALANTRIDGACLWVDEMPVIAMSLRYDRIDCFWFTLMHELAHLLANDGRLDVDLEAHRDEGEKPESERRADQFAGEHLVPKQKLDGFIARVRPLYSATRIEAFAQTVGVHPGIVVGQLQHRGEVAWANFRRTLVPIREFITGAALTDGWDSRLRAQL